jgi:hypothetical protein
VQARIVDCLQPDQENAMKTLLHRVVSLALASAVSLGLLGGVASLADSDRQAVMQAKQARTALVVARADTVRR